MMQKSNVRYLFVDFVEPLGIVSWSPRCSCPPTDPTVPTPSHPMVIVDICLDTSAHKVLTRMFQGILAKISGYGEDQGFHFC